MRTCKRIIVVFLCLNLIDCGGTLSNGYALNLSNRPAQQISDFKDQLINNSFLKLYMSIGEFFLSDHESRPFIIHIRDLHCNEEAQMNIAKTLELISKEFGREEMMVLTEGADGKVDTSFFGMFPDEKVRKDASREFLKEGKITGPEYLSIARYGDIPLRIEGIEDSKLYLDNLRAYRGVLGRSQETSQFFENLERVVDQLDRKVFSKDLYELDEKKKGYEKGTVTFEDYVQFQVARHSSLVTGATSDQQPATSNYLAEYPNLNLFVEILNKQKEIKLDQVDIERNEAINNLSEKIAKEEMGQLIKMSLEYRLGKIETQTFFGELKRMIHEYLSEGDYPTLVRYFEIVDLQAKVDHRELAEEVEKMGRVSIGNLIKTGEEKALLEFVKNLDVIRRLSMLDMTRDDLTYYSENRKKCSLTEFMKSLKELAQRYGIEKEISDKESVDLLGKVLKEGEKFYELALKRDQVMVSKALKAVDRESGIVDREGESLNNNQQSRTPKHEPRITVLITGGFHSGGVTELLKKNDVSYVVMTPKIKGEPDSSVYRSLMMDERINIGTIAFFSIFNRISELLNSSMRLDLVNSFVNHFMDWAEKNKIESSALNGWLDRWINQQGGEKSLRSSERFVELSLVERVKALISKKRGTVENRAFIERKDIHSLIWDSSELTARLTVDLLKDLGDENLLKDAQTELGKRLAQDESVENVQIAQKTKDYTTMDEEKLKRVTESYLERARDPRFKSYFHKDLNFQIKADPDEKYASFVHGKDRDNLIFGVQLLRADISPQTQLFFFRSAADHLRHPLYEVAQNDVKYYLTLEKSEREKIMANLRMLSTEDQRIKNMIHLLMTAEDWNSHKTVRGKLKLDPQIKTKIALYTGLEHKTVNLDDGSIVHYTTGGKKDGSVTLVFLHGWLLNSRDWRLQLAYLEGKYKTITIDTPGFGKSKIGKKKPSMKDYAKALKAVLEKENAANVVIIGHSMGGMIAMHYDDLYDVSGKGRVAGFVPIAASSVVTREGIANFFTRKFMRRNVEFLKFTPFFAAFSMLWAGESVKKFLRTNAAKSIIWQVIRETVLPADLLEYFERALSSVSKTPLEGIMDALAAIIEHNAVEKLKDIQVPVLWIIGENDGVLNPQMQRAQLAKIRDVETVIFEGANHFPQISNPKGVNRAIDRFVQNTVIPRIKTEGLTEGTQKGFSHMESMKLVNSKPLAWRGQAIEGLDIQAVKEKVRRESILLEQIEGKSVRVDRELLTRFSAFGFANQGDFENFLREYLSEQFKTSPPVLDEIIIANLSSSTHLFEDHKENGFVGINSQIFYSSLSTQLRLKMFKIGLRHELAHESLVYERSVLKEKTSSGKLTDVHGDVIFDGAVNVMTTDEILYYIGPYMNEVETRMMKDDVAYSVKLQVTKQDITQLEESFVLSNDAVYISEMKAVLSDEYSYQSREPTGIKNAAGKNVVHRFIDENHSMDMVIGKQLIRIIKSPGELIFLVYNLDDVNLPTAEFKVNDDKSINIGRAKTAKGVVRDFGGREIGVEDVLNDIDLPLSNSSASRRHIQLEIRDINNERTKIIFKDLTSKNGTTLYGMGEFVENQVPIRPQYVALEPANKREYEELTNGFNDVIKLMNFDVDLTRDKKSWEGELRKKFNLEKSKALDRCPTQFKGNFKKIYNDQYLTRWVKNLDYFKRDILLLRQMKINLVIRRYGVLNRSFEELVQKQVKMLRHIPIGILNKCREFFPFVISDEQDMKKEVLGYKRDVTHGTVMLNNAGFGRSEVFSSMSLRQSVGGMNVFSPVKMNEEEEEERKEMSVSPETVCAHEFYHHLHLDERLLAVEDFVEMLNTAERRKWIHYSMYNGKTIAGLPDVVKMMEEAIAENAAKAVEVMKRICKEYSFIHSTFYSPAEVVSFCLSDDLAAYKEMGPERFAKIREIAARSFLRSDKPVFERDIPGRGKVQIYEVYLFRKNRHEIVYVDEQGKIIFTGADVVRNDPQVLDEQAMPETMAEIWYRLMETGISMTDLKDYLDVINKIANDPVAGNGTVFILKDIKTLMGPSVDLERMTAINKAINRSLYAAGYQVSFAERKRLIEGAIKILPVAHYEALPLIRQGASAWRGKIIATEGIDAISSEAKTNSVFLGEIRGKRVFVDQQILAKSGFFDMNEDRFRNVIEEFLAEQFKTSPPLGDEIIIAELSSSTHLFENHLGNGFIGINQQLFEVELFPDVRTKLLKLGLRHEIRHESGVGNSEEDEKILMEEDMVYAEMMGSNLMEIAQLEKFIATESWFGMELKRHLQKNRVFRGGVILNGIRKGGSFVDGVIDKRNLKWVVKKNPNFIIENFPLGKGGVFELFNRILFYKSGWEGRGVTVELVDGKVARVFDRGGSQLYPVTEYQVYEGAQIQDGKRIGGRILSGFNDPRAMNRYVQGLPRKNVIIEKVKLNAKGGFLQLGEDLWKSMAGYERGEVDREAVSPAFRNNPVLFEKSTNADRLRFSDEVQSEDWLRVNGFRDLVELYSESQNVYVTVEVEDVGGKTKIKAIYDQSGRQLYPFSGAQVFAGGRFENGRVVDARPLGSYNDSRVLGKRLLKEMGQLGSVWIVHHKLNNVGGLAFAGKKMWQAMSGCEPGYIETEKIPESFRNNDQIFDLKKSNDRVLKFRKEMTEDELQAGGHENLVPAFRDSQDAYVTLEVAQPAGELQIRTVYNRFGEKIYPSEDHQMFIAQTDLFGRAKRGRYLGTYRDRKAVTRMISRHADLIVERVQLNDRGGLNIAGEIPFQEKKGYENAYVTVEIYQGSVSAVYSQEGAVLFKTEKPAGIENLTRLWKQEEIEKLVELFGTAGTSRVLMKFANDYNAQHILQLTRYLSKNIKKKSKSKTRGALKPLNEVFDLLRSIAMFKGADLTDVEVVRSELVRLIYPYLVYDSRYLGNIQKEIKNSELSPFLRSCFEAVIKHYQEIIRFEPKGLQRKTHLKFYQKMGIKFILKNKKVILADEPGLGKTLQALGAVVNAYEGKGAQKALIICPHISKASVWKKQIQDYLRGEQGVFVVRSRSDLIDPVKLAQARRARFIIVNYELLRGESALKFREELKRFGFDFLIMDEVHKIRKSDTQTYQAVSEFRTEYEVGISGTPIIGRYSHRLFNLLHKLYPERFGDRKLFFRAYRTDPQFMRQTLKDILLRRYSIDVMAERLEPKIEVRSLSMQSEQARIYRTLESKVRDYQNTDLISLVNLLKIAATDASFVPSIKFRNPKTGEEVELEVTADRVTLNGETYTVSKFNYYGQKRGTELVLKAKEKSITLQISKNEASFQIGKETYLAGLSWKEVPSLKYQVLDDIVNETVRGKGEKIVVFTGSVRVGKKLLQRYKQLDYPAAAILYGDVSAAQRKKILDAFNTEEEPKILIATYQVAGESISLTGARRGVIVDHPWTVQERDQIIRRLYRLGQKGEVQFTILQSKNTIDEHVAAMTVEGDLIQRILLDDPRWSYETSTDVMAKFLKESVFLGYESGMLERLKKMTRSGSKSAEKLLPSFGSDKRYVQFDGLKMTALFSNRQGNDLMIDGVQDLVKKCADLDGSSKEVLKQFFMRRFESERNLDVRVKDLILWHIAEALITGFSDIDYHGKLELMVEASTHILRQLIQDPSITLEEIRHELPDLTEPDIDRVMSFLDDTNILKFFSSLGVIESMYYLNGNLVHYQKPILIYYGETGIHYFDDSVVDRIAPDWKITKSDDVSIPGKWVFPYQVRTLSDEEEKRLARELERGNRSAERILIYSQLDHLKAAVRRIKRRIEQKFSGIMLDDDELMSRALNLIIPMVQEYAQRGVYEQKSLRLFIQENLYSKIYTLGYELVRKLFELRVDESAYRNGDSDVRKIDLIESGNLPSDSIEEEDMYKTLSRLLATMNFNSQEVRVILLNLRDGEEAGEIAELLKMDLDKAEEILKRFHEAVLKIGPEQFRRMLNGSEAVAHMEALKLKNGGPISWREREIEKEGLLSIKSEVKAQSIFLGKIRGKRVYVERQIMTKYASFNMDEAEFISFLKEFLEEQFKTSPPLQDEIIIGELSSSTHLFEDHVGNGFVGINEQLFNSDIFADLRIKLLKLGLRHELRHEAGVGHSDEEEKRMLEEDIRYANTLEFTAEGVDSLRELIESSPILELNSGANEEWKIKASLDRAASILIERKDISKRLGPRDLLSWKFYLSMKLDPYKPSIQLAFLKLLDIYLNNEIPSGDAFEPLLNGDLSGFGTRPANRLVFMGASVTIESHLLNQLMGLTVRFSLWNNKSLGEMSEHVRKAIKRIEKRTGKKPVVIEVAAGYGDLSFGLTQKFPGIRIIPTDSFPDNDLNLPESKTGFYDPEIINQRGVKKLFGAEILSGEYRKILGIEGDTPIVIVATHLPWKKGVEKDLLNQLSADEMIFVHSRRRQLNERVTGDPDILPDSKVWEVKSTSPDQNVWINGLTNAGIRDEVEIVQLTRKTEETVKNPTLSELPGKKADVGQVLKALRKSIKRLRDQFPQAQDLLPHVGRLLEDEIIPSLSTEDRSKVVHAALGELRRIINRNQVPGQLSVREYLISKDVGERIATALERKGYPRKEIEKLLNSLDTHRGPLWADLEGHMRGSLASIRVFVGLMEEAGLLRDSQRAENIESMARAMAFHEYAHQLIRPGLNDAKRADLTSRLKGFLNKFKKRFGTSDIEEVLSQFVSYKFTGENEDLFEDVALELEGYLSSEVFPLIKMKDVIQKRDEIARQIKGTQEGILEAYAGEDVVQMLLDYRSSLVTNTGLNRFSEGVRKILDSFIEIKRVDRELKMEIGDWTLWDLLGEGGVNNADQDTRLKVVSQQVNPREKEEEARRSDQSVVKLAVRLSSDAIRAWKGINKKGIYEFKGLRKGPRVYVITITKAEELTGLNEAFNRMREVEPKAQIVLNTSLKEDEIRKWMTAQGMDEKLMGESIHSKDMTAVKEIKAIADQVSKVVSGEFIAEEDMILMIPNDPKRQFSSFSPRTYKIVVGRMGKGASLLTDALGLALVLGSVDKAFDEKGIMNSDLSDKLKGYFKEIVKQYFEDDKTQDYELQLILTEIDANGFFKLPEWKNELNNRMREFAIQQTYIEVAA